MDLTPLIGPAVVAAVISSIVSVIGMCISARNARSIHTEKLAFDEKQADRRMTSDIALAEKKLALDYDLDVKKRRAVLAEEVLADFYQARDIIQDARHPGGYASEGSTRPKTDWETDRDASLLDSYYRTTERLLTKADFFAQLHAKRYRFLASFGPETGKSFDEIFQVRHEMNVAVYMLITTQRNVNLGREIPEREKMESRIWDTQEADDPITARLNQSVQNVEAICQPIIRDNPR